MHYDLLIIGAGIVGMATALEAQRRWPDKSIAVIEKESGPAKHQTGHNSGVIHAGVYYTPGSLKAKLCLAGNQATKAFCDEHGIDYEVCGKLIVATNADELGRMQGLYQRCAENGIEREWWDGAQLRDREPNINGLAGIFVPSTGIVSYTAITQKMLEIFVTNGGDVKFDSPVTSISEQKDKVLINAGQEAISGDFVIACAGLYADKIAEMSGQTPDFIICPFRGEYYQLAAKHNAIVKHLIYPVPDPGVPFLGVHLTRMIDGSVTVGPNAVLAMAREGYHKSDIDPAELWQMLRHKGLRQVMKKNFRHGLKEQRNSLLTSFYLKEVQKYCPSITREDLQPYPAGVRAQAVSHDGALVDDFHWLHTPRMLHVCNAPSPAATSAMPIAVNIIDQVVERIQ